MACVCPAWAPYAVKYVRRTPQHDAIVRILRRTRKHDASVHFDCPAGLLVHRAVCGLKVCRLGCDTRQVAPRVLGTAVLAVVLVVEHSDGPGSTFWAVVVWRPDYDGVVLQPQPHTQSYTRVYQLGLCMKPRA